MKTLIDPIFVKRITPLRKVCATRCFRKARRGFFLNNFLLPPKSKPRQMLRTLCLLSIFVLASVSKIPNTSWYILNPDDYVKVGNSVIGTWEDGEGIIFEPTNSVACLACTFDGVAWVTDGKGFFSVNCTANAAPVCVNFTMNWFMMFRSTQKIGKCGTYHTPYHPSPQTCIVDQVYSSPEHWWQKYRYELTDNPLQRYCDYITGNEKMELGCIPFPPPTN
jgi:hypothetical protein